MSILKVFAIVGFAFWAVSSFAGSTATTVFTPGGNNNETQGYVGLEWTWGSATPQAILGVKKVEVEADGDTQGFGAVVAFNIESGFTPYDVKVTVLDGNEKTQAEAGLGYEFLEQTMFLTGGANTTHASVGLDVSSGGVIRPFGAVHSQGKFDVGTVGSAQCVQEPTQPDNPTIVTPGPCPT